MEVLLVSSFRPSVVALRVFCVLVLVAVSATEGFQKTQKQSASFGGFRSCARVGSELLHRPAEVCENLSASQPSSNSKTGLYIHIPYCRRRCRYCDFAIVPIGPQENHEMNDGFQIMNDNYTKAIFREIDSIKSSSRIVLRSVYFGGGTPSLAPVSTLQAIMERIKQGPFQLQDDCEITIEMDPGTFTAEKLQAVKNLGFNRISLGIQSFNDSILESLGRVHRFKDISESISILDQVYGDSINYSIDLISGLPGLSLAEWAETLSQATLLSPKPSHLSVYDLQIESGTVFGNWYPDKAGSRVFHSTRGEVPYTMRAPLPSEEDAAYMYKYASGYLRAKGYEHYEVSSYALPGHRSQHNQIYWDAHGSWYACGLGATSFVEKKVVARPRALADYVLWTEEHSNATILADEIIDDFEYLSDVILKRLRTCEGLSLKWIREFFPRYEAAVMKGASLGLELKFVIIEGDALRLSDPSGFLYSNTIISSIFAELEETRASESFRTRTV